MPGPRGFKQPDRKIHVFLTGLKSWAFAGTYGPASNRPMGILVSTSIILVTNTTISSQIMVSFLRAARSSYKDGQNLNPVPPPVLL